MSSESDSEKSDKLDESSDKSLWKVYGNLTKDPTYLKIYNRLPQPITRKSGLKDLITETEKSMGYTIQSAFLRFKQRINPNDPEDKLHLSSISFKAFIRRMGNLILEDIYKRGNYEKTLAEFILDVKGEANDGSSYGDRSESDSDSASSFHELTKVGESIRKDIESNLDVSEIPVKQNKSKNFTKNSGRNRSGSGSSDNSRVQSMFSNKGDKSGRSEKSYKSGRSEKSDKSGRSEKSDKSGKSGRFEKSAKDDSSEKSDKGDKNNRSRNSERSQKSKDSSERSQKSRVSSESQRDESEEIKKVDKGKKPPIVKTLSKPNQIAEKPSQKKVISKKLTNSSNSPTKLGINSSVNKVKVQSDSSSSSSKKKSLQKMNISEQAIKEVRKNLSKKAKKSPKSPKMNALGNIFLTNLSQENLKSWFLTAIKGEEPEFKSIFELNKKEFQVPKDLPEVFESTLRKLSIFPHKHHKDWFKTILETFHPIKTVQKLGSRSKILQPRINFLNFIEMMNAWGEKYQKEQETVVGDLVESINHYKKLSDSNSNFPGLESKIQILTIKLEKTLEKYLESHKNHSSLLEKYKKSLDDVFQFYTRVQRIQGTGDTFEDMEANNTNLSLPKFLKFCSDFQLILNKGDDKTKRALSKESFITIFKKTANNTRLMSQPQFIEALDRIAEQLYTPEFDKLLGTDLALKTLDDKRKHLFEQLELNKFDKYHSKKKTFGIAFSPEKYSRIPLSESSQQYKFKISEDNLKKLENWKKMKNARESPQLLDPIKEIIKSSHPIIRKSSKKLPASGYAQRSKLKKPEVKAEERSEEVEEISENRSEKVEQVVSKAKIITMQGLNSLKYNDLDDEFSIKDLITEDSDEFFDKLYGIEPNLQKIMKMHDDKLARGQKVIEKNKYRVN